MTEDQCKGVCMGLNNEAIKLIALFKAVLEYQL